MTDAPRIMHCRWGTKGSDKAENLASVQTKKEKDGDDGVVEVEEPTQAAIDERFKQSGS